MPDPVRWQWPFSASKWIEERESLKDRFEAFITGVTVCYKYIQRIKSLEMTELGLKGTHVTCLFYLSNHPGGLTAAQLCQLCAEDKASVSRTVADLRSRGYIAPSERHYRTPLKLTEEGRQAAQKMEPLIQRWVQSGGDGLTDAQREVFYKSLAMIGENLRSRLEEDEK